MAHAELASHVIFTFDEFELDLACGELRRGAAIVPLEPRAFALLSVLVEHHDRLVTREELIDTAWDGRIVSDAAISTGVKSVRKALGDDGTRQKYVRTLHGRGFRFVGPVRLAAARGGEPTVVETEAPAAAPGKKPAEAHRPSLAILPFGLLGRTENFNAIGDAIPAELISSLSRLRWLRVVARGSSFRFREREPDFRTIRTSLGANYCLSGIVEIFGKSLAVEVELVDTRSGGVVWGERFPAKVDDIHDIRARIVSQVIAALELHIPLNEANQARLRAPDDLDAWGEYHIGLQHMYRFNRSDNAIAAARFERATSLDPHFARAFAARSFTSFQDAFLKYSGDPERARSDALRFAQKGMELDPLDPFANFNLARTFWLEGNPDGGLDMLDRAVLLSPNFSHGLYARAWTDVMAGRGARARASVTEAIELSPLDPFLYAMQATRGLSYLVEGDFQRAALWAEKGARAPGAHFLIGAIAIAAHELNQDSAKADYWSRNVRARREDASLKHFFTAFPFSDPDLRAQLAGALGNHGF